MLDSKFEIDGLEINLNPEVNPYLRRLFEYPGRIFTGFVFEDDAKRVKELIQSHNGEVIVEFGSGSGAHLIECAAKNSSTFCLGFETRFKRAVRTLDKALERGIDNIYVLRHAYEYANECLPLGSIDTLCINFPDPWSKKKWHKHRVLTRSSIEDLLPLLKKGGVFSIKTDHAEYFESFIADLNIESEEPGYFVEEICRNLERRREGIAGVESEFEKLFRNQAKPIHYCRIVRS